MAKILLERRIVILEIEPASRTDTQIQSMSRDMTRMSSTTEEQDTEGDPLPFGMREEGLSEGAEPEEQLQADGMATLIITDYN